MQITDTIADILTRIRNANSAKHATVDVPASNMKKSIAQILVDEGYIKSFQIIDDGKQGIIRITLKYGENKGEGAAPAAGTAAADAAPTADAGEFFAPVEDEGDELPF